HRTTASHHSSPFLSQCSPPHPHLPSFPTRRSSDLRRAGGPSVGECSCTTSRNRNQRGKPPWTASPRSSSAPAPSEPAPPIIWLEDRKSTRLNSSHRTISYAVFCLKKKKHNYNETHR